MAVRKPLVVVNGQTEQLQSTDSVGLAPSIVTLTDAATIATDASLALTPNGIFRVTLAASRIMGAPTNPTDGQRIVYEIRQDATGGRTITWNAVFTFNSDVTQPTLTVTANKYDKIAFQYNLAANEWQCVAKIRGLT